MSRIVFLDFDGVVNSGAWLAERGPVTDEERRLAATAPPDALPDYVVGSAMERSHLHSIRSIDPGAIEHLNALVRLTDAHVVVSSTWRHGYTLNGLRWLLSARGFVGQVIGVTPSDPRHQIRGEEIQAWLDLLGSPLHVRFVILDDDSDMGPLTPKLVRTDRSVGLTAPDAARAAAMLLSGTAPLHAMPASR